MTAVMIEVETKDIVKSNNLLHMPLCDKTAKKNRSNPQSPLQKPESNINSSFRRSGGLNYAINTPCDLLVMDLF